MSLQRLGDNLLNLETEWALLTPVDLVIKMLERGPVRHDPWQDDGGEA